MTVLSPVPAGRADSLNYSCQSYRPVSWVTAAVSYVQTPRLHPGKSLLWHWDVFMFSYPTFCLLCSLKASFLHSCVHSSSSPTNHCVHSLEKWTLHIKKKKNIGRNVNPHLGLAVMMITMSDPVKKGEGEMRRGNFLESQEKKSCLVASENKVVPRIAARLQQTQQGRVKYLAMGQLSPHIKHSDTRRAPCVCVCCKVYASCRKSQQKAAVIKHERSRKREAGPINHINCGGLEALGRLASGPLGTYYKT